MLPEPGICTLYSLFCINRFKYCCVKESTLCPWLHRFLEAHEMYERNKEKEESFPYHTLFQVHHHQKPKLTKFFQTCGRVLWVVTCQQGLASDIISHSVLHTGDLCKERHTQKKVQSVQLCVLTIANASNSLEVMKVLFFLLEQLLSSNWIRLDF